METRSGWILAALVLVGAGPALAALPAMTRGQEPQPQAVRRLRLRPGRIQAPATP